MTEPTFSSVSADQEAIDKELGKKNEEMNLATQFHILEGKKCRKLAPREAIVACQKQSQILKVDKK